MAKAPKTSTAAAPTPAATQTETPKTAEGATASAQADANAPAGGGAGDAGNTESAPPAAPPAATSSQSVPIEALIGAPDGAVLFVSGPPGGRRRAGREFGPEPVAVPIAELDEEQLRAIVGDPLLTHSLVGIEAA